ncbi:MAG: ATP-binding protein [Burkholderiales bacterium]
MRQRRPAAKTLRLPTPSAATGVVLRRLKAELRDARLALQQARADRQLSEQRFRSVFNQQFQFMVILGPQGHVLEISEQLPLDNGAVPPEQIVGSLIWDTVWWRHTPEMRARWPARLREAAQANCPVLSEDMFNSPTGEPRVAAAAITAVKDAAGNVDCFIVQGTDITDRKEAETRRLQLEAQLRETHKMQAIGTLAGGIAHDFNNILAAILGNLALAQQDLPPGHAAQARLEQIRKAASRARSLVQQILAFSRRQPHELVLQPLQPVLEETLDLLRTTLPASVALVVRVTDEPLWVNADATQMQQVVMNLCTNAWHSLPGSRGRVEVGLVRAGAPPPPYDEHDAPHAEWIHLWVRDNGSGMDEATLARVFEPFFTTRARAEGTGLGLSVVHGIVAEHGGVITVESAPGQGSTFHVALPIAGNIDATPLAPEDPVAAPQGTGQHVLYVDDDEMMVVMVQGLLQRASYRVTVCTDAAGAIAALRAQPAAFDIVVTDYNMPRGSGLDVARAARVIRPGLPVVVSSGYLSEELRAAAIKVGVRVLLQKENTVEELGGVLRDMLG